MISHGLQPWTNFYNNFDNKYDTESQTTFLFIQENLPQHRRQWNARTLFVGVCDSCVGSNGLNLEKQFNFNTKANPIRQIRGFLQSYWLPPGIRHFSSTPNCIFTANNRPGFLYWPPAPEQIEHFLCMCVCVWVVLQNNFVINHHFE